MLFLFLWENHCYHGQHSFLQATQLFLWVDYQWTDFSSSIVSSSYSNVFCAALGVSVGMVSAVDVTPESPISQAACDVIKTIQTDNENNQFVSCIVQQGCATIECSSPLATETSSEMTFQPCTDPPSILVEFFNSSISDEALFNTTLTRSTTLPAGEFNLVFYIAQVDNGIELQVTAN